MLILLPPEHPSNLAPQKVGGGTRWLSSAELDLCVSRIINKTFVFFKMVFGEGEGGLLVLVYRLLVITDSRCFF